MSMLVWAENELARWCGSDPDPSNIEYAHAALKLLRVIASSGIKEDDHGEVLRIARRLAENMPMTPLTDDPSEWRPNAGFSKPGWSYNSRWPRLERRPDGTCQALIDFANDCIYASVLCEVTLPFEVPDQPVPIGPRVVESVLGVSFNGFKPLEVVGSWDHRSDADDPA